MRESRPSEEAIALFTNVFGYAPDPETLHAGECWQAERIDAALRRAKAEVWREIVMDLKGKHINFEQKLSVTRSSFMQDEYEANIELLNVLITEYDARAAQIEEGE